MRRLLRFLKLAECLDKNNDTVGLQTLCAQFNSFVKKHGHFVPDNDGKTPNPWRRNMDYVGWENSPYFGSVSEFMEKFPGGISDWVKWRRETQEDRNKKWDIKKASEIEYLGEEESEEETSEAKQKALELIEKNIEMYKEMANLSNEDIIKWLESKYGKMVKAHFVDVKKDRTEKFPKEPHLWSGDGPSSFKSILEFIKKYRSQDAKDSDAAGKAVIDFINYWKLLKNIKRHKKNGDE